MLDPAVDVACRHEGVCNEETISSIFHTSSLDRLKSTPTFFRTKRILYLMLEERRMEHCHRNMMVVKKKLMRLLIQCLMSYSLDKEVVFRKFISKMLFFAFRFNVQKPFVRIYLERKHKINEQRAISSSMSTIISFKNTMLKKISFLKETNKSER